MACDNEPDYGGLDIPHENASLPGCPARPRRWMLSLPPGLGLGLGLVGNGINASIYHTRLVARQGQGNRASESARMKINDREEMALSLISALSSPFVVAEEGLETLFQIIFTSPI